ncbi:MAG: DNA recombination protein RmuC [Acidimicrobiales bacterium]
MVIGLIVGVVLGGLLGGVLAALAGSARAASRLATAHEEHSVALVELRGEAARLQGALEQERALSGERQAALEEARRQLAGDFAELSAKALEQNSARFADLAVARFKESQQVATGDLEQRKQAIEQLLTPLREQLGRYEAGLRQLELDRKAAYTGLLEQVKFLSESQDKLQAETRNLVTALRAPATRGRWGEMQLRRVVEMAGMLEHCDFDEQVTSDSDDGRVRPDMVVRLPGGRCVVVDAKVPLQAFLDANDATDEETRRTHLVAHARQVRNHVDALSKKAYWQQFQHTPEFVVAFIPGDPLLTAAFEQDPDLYEHALAQSVVLATPANLIGLLRIWAGSWQQEALADNAREVQRMGGELFKRLATFVDHMGKVRRGLMSTVDAYDKAVGSLERSVLPQARRFQELGVVVGDKEIAELEEVGVVPRQPLVPELGTPPLELVVENRPDQLPGVAGA